MSEYSDFHWRQIEQLNQPLPYKWVVIACSLALLGAAWLKVRESRADPKTERK